MPTDDIIGDNYLAALAQEGHMKAHLNGQTQDIAKLLPQLQYEVRININLFYQRLIDIADRLTNSNLLENMSFNEPILLEGILTCISGQTETNSNLLLDFESILIRFEFSSVSLLHQKVSSCTQNAHCGDFFASA